MGGLRTRTGPPYGMSASRTTAHRTVELAAGAPPLCSHAAGARRLTVSASHSFRGR